LRIATVHAQVLWTRNQKRQPMQVGVFVQAVWLRKNLSISAEASGPAGSVYDPALLPPAQAWPAPCISQYSATLRPLLSSIAVLV
jgi:hypothetical protein